MYFEISQYNKTIKNTQNKCCSKTQSSQSIQIAGAGIAGLTAAITLALEGRQVIVHEMHKKVGYRFDGDFQGLENWTTSEDALEVLKKHNLTTDFNALACHKGTFFDSKDKRYEVKTNRALFYLTRARIR